MNVIRMEDALDVVVVCKTNELDKPWKHKGKEELREFQVKLKRNCLKFEMFYIAIIVYSAFDIIRLSAWLPDMKFQSG